MDSHEFDGIEVDNRVIPPEVDNRVLPREVDNRVVPQEVVNQHSLVQSYYPSDKMSPVETLSPYEAPAAQEKRIVGLRRATFFLLLSNIVLVILLVAVATAEGVLLAKNNNNNQTCASRGGSSGGAPGSSTNASDASPKVCFTSTTAASPPGYPTDTSCPTSGDATTYMVPGTNLTFQRSCESDYTGNDMGRFPVNTMADCLVLCAQLALYPSSVLGPCKGATWVFADTQGTGISYCYPKSDASNVTARTGAQSARLL